MLYRKKNSRGVVVGGGAGGGAINAFAAKKGSAVRRLTSRMRPATEIDFNRSLGRACVCAWEAFQDIDE